MSAFPIDSVSRIIESHDERGSRLPAIAAACSIVAALTHAWVVRSHLNHWWAYGAFFAGLAVAQAGYGILVARIPGRRLALAGAAVNIGLLALYAWSRTAGVPMGPHAGRPESIAAPDIVAATAEVALIGVLFLIWRAGSGASNRRAGRAGMAAVTVALIAAGIAGPVGHAHPRLPAVTLAPGPESWIGLPPTIPTPNAPVEPSDTEPAPPVEEEVSKCLFKTVPGISAPAPAGPGEARAVAYTSENDVWIYDPAKNSTQRLTDNGEFCWVHAPSFRTPTYLSFDMQDTVYGLDLETGEVEELFHVKNGISAASWSPDGKTLAYMSWGSNGGPQVVLFRAAEGSKTVVRTLAEAPGRCGSEDDEMSISWAPDGHALIVVATGVITEDETMYVINPTGADLVAPRPGTDARWAPDSKRIYYRDYLGDRKWHTLNSETGDTGTLGGMKPGTHDLAVSPDGSLLAYHDGDQEVATYVFDVATKEQWKVADDAVMAIWIGPRTLLVSDTKPCGDECFHSAWMAKDTTSTVDVITKVRKPAAAGTTWDSDAWIEPPAESEPVPSPSTPPPATPTPGESESPSPLPLPTGEPTPGPSPTPTGDPAPSPTPTPTD